MPSPRRTTRMLAVALAIASGGCARVADVVVLDKPPPRVSLKGYPMDIAFGEAPIVPEVDSGAKPLAQLAAEVFEFEDFGPPPVRRAPGPFGPAPEACPEPGPSAVAVEPITANVRRGPTPGVYLFVQEGKIDLESAIANLTQPVGGFTSRRVFDVQEQPDHFAFSVDQTIGRRRAELTIESVPGQQVGLGKIVREVAGGQVVFDPVVPVQILPLPVAENQTVTGVGVDPVNGTSMVVQGTVVRKERVDGCDEVADGWLVEGSWTINGPRGSTRFDIQYVVATQYGGLIIRDAIKFEETETQSGVPFTYRHDITTRFGSVTPKPDPEAS